MPPKYSNRKKKTKKSSVSNKRHSVKLRRSTLKRSIFNNRTSNNLKHILSLGAVFILSLAFLFIFLFFVYLNKNSTFALNDEDVSYYSDTFPTLLIVTVDSFESSPAELIKLDFMVFDTTSQKNTIYSVPVGVQVDYPGKYGVEELSKAFAFGGIINENDEFNTGLSLLKYSLFNLFGIRPVKYIVVTEEYSHNIENFLFNGQLASFIKDNITAEYSENVRTNMSVQEIYQRYQYLRSVPSDRNVKKTLSMDFMENTEAIDNELRDLTIDSPLNTEKYSIAVLNASHVDGAAAFVSRAVTNVGGRVVASNNASQEFENSVIVTDQQDSKTTSILSEIFGINTILAKNDFDTLNQAEFDRADIVIVIGFDIAKQM